MNILEDIYCYILEYIGGYLMFTFLDYIGGYLLLNSWIYWRIFNVYNSWIYCLHFMNLFEDIGKKNEQNWCWENSWFAGSRQVNKKSIQKQRKQTHVYQQTNASMPTNKHTLPCQKTNTSIPTVDPSETHRRLIGDRHVWSEIYRRIIRDRHVCSETHRRPTCLIGAP